MPLQEGNCCMITSGVSSVLLKSKKVLLKKNELTIRISITSEPTYACSPLPQAGILPE